MELVAVLIAFAALVISLIALYLTSLRPAEVEIDHIPRNDELPAGSFWGPRPSDHDLFLAVFVSNAGARGGLLESVSIADVKTVGGEPFWVGGRCELTRERRELRPESLLPLALEAGDVHSAFVSVKLHGHGISSEQLMARWRALRGEISPTEASVVTEEEAARIGAMESIEVTVAWRFTRTAGLPVASRRLPRRLRRRRERVKRVIRVRVDARHYRDRCIERWQAHDGYHHLADIAVAARGW